MPGLGTGSVVGDPRHVVVVAPGCCFFSLRAPPPPPAAAASPGEPRAPTPESPLPNAVGLKEWKRAEEADASTGAALAGLAPRFFEDGDDDDGEDDDEDDDGSHAGWRSCSGTMAQPFPLPPLPFFSLRSVTSDQRFVEDGGSPPPAAATCGNPAASRCAPWPGYIALKGAKATPLLRSIVGPSIVLLYTTNPQRQRERERESNGAEKGGAEKSKVVCVRSHRKYAVVQSGAATILRKQLRKNVGGWQSRR